MQQNYFHYRKDSDGIVTLTMDWPGQEVNTVDRQFVPALAEVIDQLEAEREQITGVVLTSAKKTFFAGGDLKWFITLGPSDAAEIFAVAEQVKALLRRLEKLGRPVVAAIAGAALGGGWEIALACHQRVVLDDPSIQLGQPEVTLGLLPGGGGITRMVRLLGLQEAMPYLLEGKLMRPAEAAHRGLAALAKDGDDLLAQARAWIAANPAPEQPWDRKGYKLPGGAPSSPHMAQMLTVAPAMLVEKTHGVYPAPKAILSAAVEGAQVPFDVATRIESRYFVELVTGQVAKNMIDTFFFQLNEIKGGAARPKDVPRWKATKVGVLGAGMMGSGIAYANAARGIPTVLKDVTIEQAEQGKAYSARITVRRVERGQLSAARRQELLDRIHPTADAGDLAGCNLIIEAVFEIVKGQRTSAETLARAYDYVQQIGKIPIVVNDSRGFFTSRVIRTFLNEAASMLGEGIAPAVIEHAALQAGFPTGPLALLDEVSLKLAIAIADEARRAASAAGHDYADSPGEMVMRRMVGEFGRPGKAGGAGFYEYPRDGGKKYLWPGLSIFAGDRPGNAPIDVSELKDRMLYVQSIETLRCLEEGVLESVRDAHIGSIFGIGFPGWTGGAIQFINYVGVRAFAARTEELARKHGPRFAPPRLLRERAERDEAL